MENQTEHIRKGVRVVLFPLPLQGHINPMLQLANILHSRGFSITVVHTKVNSPNPLKHPQFTFRQIPDGLSESEASDPDLIAFMTRVDVKVVDPLRDCLAQLLGDGSGEPIGCLITDAVLRSSRVVAEEFKLPWFVLQTGSVANFLTVPIVMLLREKGYSFPIKDSLLEDPIPEMPPLRLKDLPLSESFDPDGYCAFVDAIFKECRAASGHIWNSIEELEQPELAKLRTDFSNPVFPIGPFHRYFPSSSGSLFIQDQTSISWLDKQAPKSVIYVSYGSLATMSKKEFLEMAWGLANSNHPFLWVVRPDNICGSEWLSSLPNGFLESLEGRGKIVKWAPQQEVLAHQAVGAFWTHNGWNSTLESIWEGVPMICFPCFGDQKVNARYVTHALRVGLELEKLEKEEIEKIIRRLMLENEGDEIRERSLLLKQKVQLCLKQGGSSYESLESLMNFIATV